MVNIFSSPDWITDAIFYEIFPDRFANGDPTNDPQEVVAWNSSPTRDNHFGGDLQGIADRLPYLQDLGVNGIYLTPVFKAGSNHKYDTFDYFKIDPAFGTNELLRSLVEEAHRRGIRVILDAVFNHCGEGFWAFEDVLKHGESSQYLSWFQIDRLPIHRDPPTYQTCGTTPYLPKLNTCNKDVRNYLLRVGSFWVSECGIDGWRLDVPWKVPLEFWYEFRDRIRSLKPEAYIVAESWRDTRPWMSEGICNGIMNYPLRDFILGFCVNEKLDAEDLDYEIRRQLDLLGPNACRQLNLLGSHDTPRILTLCNQDAKRAILAVTLLFTCVGVPMIYYGDEVGMLGDDDPDCRRAMVWEESAWNQEILHTYRNLVSLRRTHPSLRSQNYKTLWVFNGVYAFKRWSNEEEMVIVVNAREPRRDMRIPSGTGNHQNRMWQQLNGHSVFREREGMIEIEHLPSMAALILSPSGFDVVS